MDENKVTITEHDIYGFQIESPEFKPEIKVKFALDIPVSKRRKLQDLFRDINGIKKIEMLPKEEQDELSKKYGELLIQIMVLDWNLYDSEGNKLLINADTLDNKISIRLSKWIFKKATDFFTTPDKIEEKS